MKGEKFANVFERNLKAIAVSFLATEKSGKPYPVQGRIRLIGGCAARIPFREKRNKINDRAPTLKSGTEFGL